MSSICYTLCRRPSTYWTLNAIPRLYISDAAPPSSYYLPFSQRPICLYLTPSVGCLGACLLGPSSRWMLHRAHTVPRTSCCQSRSASSKSPTFWAWSFSWLEMPERRIHLWGFFDRWEALVSRFSWSFALFWNRLTLEWWKCRYSIWEWLFSP